MGEGGGGGGGRTRTTKSVPKTVRRIETNPCGFIQYMLGWLLLLQPFS